MIETLVALLILAVGLLGMLAMQMRGAQLNQAGYYQSQAMFMAEDIVERIRANLAAVNSYAILSGDDGDQSAADCNTLSSPCSLAEIAAADLFEWKTALNDFLPDGDGLVNVGDPENNVYPITVRISYQQGEPEPMTYQLEANL